MKIRKKENVIRYSIDELICDKCGRRAHQEHDFMEYSEFMSIKWIGGYGNNTIGDMATREIDVCQYCWHELTKDFARKLDEPT